PTSEPSARPRSDPIAKPARTRCAEIATCTCNCPRCHRSTPASTTEPGEGSWCAGTSPPVVTRCHTTTIASGTTTPSATSAARARRERRRRPCPLGEALSGSGAQPSAVPAVPSLTARGSSSVRTGPSAAVRRSPWAGVRWLRQTRGRSWASVTGPVPVPVAISLMVSLARGACRCCDGDAVRRAGGARSRPARTSLGDRRGVGLLGEARVEQLVERGVDVRLARDVAGLDEDRPDDLEHRDLLVARDEREVEVRALLDDLLGDLDRHARGLGKELGRLVEVLEGVLAGLFVGVDDDLREVRV